MLLEKNVFIFVAIHDSDKTNAVRSVYGTFEDCKHKLRNLNENGYGIFAAVNEFRSAKRVTGNVSKIRSLFIDIDDIDLERTFNYKLEPSCIIETSPGKHHVYWYTADDFPIVDFKEYQTALAATYGGDQVVVDIPRIMRLPGFLHQKGEPFESRVIGGNDKRYDFETLTEFVNPDRDNAAVGELKKLMFELTSAKHGERNSTLNRVAYQVYALVKADRVKRSVAETVLTKTAIKIGLEPHEIETTLASAYAAASAKKADGALFDVLEVSEKRENSLIVVSGSDVTPIAYSWVWKGWLARGAMHILAGAPSTGKTTVAVGLGATISAGGYMPDGEYVEPQLVVVWSGEDSIEATLTPRFIASGANMANVRYITEVRDEEIKKRRAFDPSTDADTLHRFLAEHRGQIGLIIIDPIISTVAGDAHKNTEVRKALQIYVNMATVADAPILGITHLSKGTQGKDPLERVTGSIAFGAVARFVFMCVKNADENSTKRLFVKVKANIERDVGGFEYELKYTDKIAGHDEIGSTYATFGKFSDVSARTLLEEAEASTEQKQETYSAREYIAEAIEDGKAVKTLLAECRNMGLTPSTLRRTAESLGYRITNTGKEQIFTRK